MAKEAIAATIAAIIAKIRNIPFRVINLTKVKIRPCPYEGLTAF
jgi:hypothetical protein